MTNQTKKKADSAALPDENQVVDYLISHPEFFVEHAPLLGDLQIPHETGSAVSLVERQIMVLRDKNEHFEKKLREMVDAVHDNQRLHDSLHRLSINLFAADSLDDILGIVDDELRHKLGTDFVYFRLTTDALLHNKDKVLESTQGHTYVADDDEVLELFAPLIEKKNIQCGLFSNEEIEQLFMKDAGEVASAAIIPVEDAGIRGLIALGSRDKKRYHAGMGTDFLTSLATLISAAMKSQLAR
ncbi:Protein of unknown function DUF484 [hydrothermal vent metagenome]|uniref:DUF484 domain-containing protein n=1 Tax=hydrothermal vent metagenome TaxID=652676 RepID=A0A3B0YKP0_9ZZZZ